MLKWRCGNLSDPFSGHFGGIFVMKIEQHNTGATVRTVMKMRGDDVGFEPITLPWLLSPIDTYQSLLSYLEDLLAHPGIRSRNLFPFCFLPQYEWKWCSISGIDNRQNSELLKECELAPPFCLPSHPSLFYLLLEWSKFPPPPLPHTHLPPAHTHTHIHPERVRVTTGKVIWSSGRVQTETP